MDTFAVDSAARPEQNAGVGLHRKIPWYQGKLQGIFFAHHAIALRCSKTERRSPSSIVQKQYCHQIEWYSSIGLAELIYDVKPQDWNLTKKSNDFVSFTRLIENIFR